MRPEPPATVLYLFCNGYTFDIRSSRATRLVRTRLTCVQALMISEKRLTDKLVTLYGMEGVRSCLYLLRTYASNCHPEQK